MCVSSNVTDWFDIQFYRRNNIRSASVQTDDSRFEDRVELQLRQVEESFQKKSSHTSETSSKSMEELMMKYRRECDERAAEHIKRETERIRNTEIAQMRLEESEKYREEMILARERMERTFEERSARLRCREESIDQRLRDRQREMEGQEFQRRQKLLAEIEMSRVRETEMKVSLYLRSFLAPLEPLIDFLLISMSVIEGC